MPRGQPLATLLLTLCLITSIPAQTMIHIYRNDGRDGLEWKIGEAVERRVEGSGESF